MKNTPPCRPDCPKRSAICHGKNPDGSWRCPDWEVYQQREAERREKVKAAKRGIREVSDYRYGLKADRLHKESRKAK